MSIHVFGGGCVCGVATEVAACPNEPVKDANSSVKTTVESILAPQHVRALTELHVINRRILAIRVIVYLQKCDDTVVGFPCIPIGACPSTVSLDPSRILSPILRPILNLTLYPTLYPTLNQNRCPILNQY